MEQSHEKPTGRQLLKKFSAFYGIRNFITATPKSPPPVPILSQIKSFSNILIHKGWT